LPPPEFAKPASGLLFPFSKDDLNRTQGESEMFPELIGQIALVREMDVFRIIGKEDKSGWFDFDLGGIVNLDPLTTP
jgi:hypothetical protein